MSKYIVIFGDSIAFGYSDYETGGWPHMLRHSLLGIDEESHVYNLSIPGNTSANLLKRIIIECRARLSPGFKNDNIIILAIGTNDCRINNKTDDSVETSLGNFEENIKKIIYNAKKYASTIMFLSILPCNENVTTPTIWSEGEFFYNKNIDKYNQLIKKICKQEKIAFLDANSEWKKSQFVKMLDQDGLHPNSKGHNDIFEKVRDYLRKNSLIY